MAVIVLLGTVGAFTLFIQGIALVGPVKAALLSCLEPLTAATLVRRLAALQLFFDGSDRVCVHSGNGGADEVEKITGFFRMDVYFCYRGR